MEQTLQHLKQLILTTQTKEKIDSLKSWNNGNGSKTYFDELQKEIHETLIEYKAGNQVHLEDELGDILWDYLNLLTNLQKEGKIESIEKVFQRANKKYDERITGIQNNINWEETKIKQKVELKQEQEKLGNK
jgi:NTP pyrophosphatase (non-canonical NTP hydrolase)